MRMTIVIPTYNRNEILLKNICHLLPQLTSQCKLLIIDNHSDVYVSETLLPVLNEFPDVRCEIVRNRVNIGAVANILRSFEMCQTEWLWILSDDDTVRPDAIATILEYTDLYPDSLYFNFSSELYSRDDLFITKGSEEFIEKLDSFWNALFISTGVYKTSAIVSNLRVAYTYAYSQAPQFVILLTSLDRDGSCVFSNRRIVTWNPPHIEQQWSFVNVCLGIMTILELPLEAQLREKLAEKILASAPVLKYLGIQLLLLSVTYKDHRNVLYLYDQLCSRLYYFDTGVRRKAEILFYRIILRFPHMSYRAINAYKSLRGSSMREHPLQDRYTRM